MLRLLRLPLFFYLGSHLSPLRSWECVILDHVLIDHRRTSRDHPQVDGLVESMVQTFKKGLRNICLTKNKEDWDLAFLYIAMGYKMSKHASLFHFSLYFLLFGKHRIPPSSIAAQMDQVVDLDSPATWARVIAERLLYSGGLCPWPWRTCPLHNIETPYSMHTHKVAVTNLR